MRLLPCRCPQQTAMLRERLTTVPHAHRAGAMRGYARTAMAPRGHPGAALPVDPLAVSLGERFRTAGDRLYLGGGAVREILMGHESRGDFDFATDARPEETVRILQGWAEWRKLVGIRFGTVGAGKEGRQFEITTFRKEVYPADDRHPNVTFGDRIEEDLSRRDFTINAMAVRVPEGEFVDPFGGVKDLAARRLDTPLDPEVSFSDDPLRMVRAARFASQLDVTPSPRVVDAIGRMHGRLSIGSSERISEELSKLLLGGAPSKGLQLVVDTGLA